ncbi:class I adenylate-forming enzyme family protein [Candidatus Palauibacter sp.]|uniref:class I adenylate-forming enzyme family protein n=1 Tax=Candidatus Palauibacter sp. TaxID=3101350 RepID=UPI003B012A4B
MTPAEYSKIPPLSVADLFAGHVESHPHAPCLWAGGGSWSYSRVASQARALAVGLHNLGVEPGDRVAIALPNWPEFVISALAAAEAGAVLVPINPTCSARELRFILRNSEAAVAITAEAWSGIDYLQRFESLLIELPDLQYVVTVGEEDLWYDDRIFQYEDLIAAGRGREAPPAEVDPGRDSCAIFYTSGTTGAPKGVVLTHDNLVRTALGTAHRMMLGREDRTLCSVPLANIFGLTAMLTTLGTGGSLLLQEMFDPAGALALAAEHEATVVHGVPTMFVMLLREIERAGSRPDSLRTGVLAGAPVREDFVRDVRRRLVPDLEVAYGLTETSPTVSITTRSDPEAKRAHTVGRPLDGVEIKVLEEDGSELPGESVGQLAVRGFNVMRGYFRQPGQTRKTMTDDGFLKTGDLAMVDPEGYLHIVGRLSDAIIRGGYSIHPAEIEAQLRSHPAVDEAVVLGVPNDVLGELICACVLTVEGALITAEEIRDFCHESLADNRVPDVIHFLDELPEASTAGARRVSLARIIRAEAESRTGQSAR